MTIFTCKWEWDSILSCIYAASNSKLKPGEIRIEYEPIGQYSVFDTYVNTKTDITLAEKVSEGICTRISQNFYYNLWYLSLASEKDTADIIFRMILLGFAHGEQALKMTCYKEVLRYNDILKHLGNEIHNLKGFTRFIAVNNSVYVAIIEPKCKAVAALGPAFEDRMPSEHWMIVDSVHMEAVVHPKNENYYIRKLNDDELSRILQVEESSDEFTTLWKAFFNSIAIKERANEKCQNSHFPKWIRKHATEFME